jgi:Arc/MetJ family transcription regulator
MDTHLQLSQQLVDTAMQLGDHHTKSETVHQALEHYVRELEEQRLMHQIGFASPEPVFDHAHHLKHG